MHPHQKVPGIYKCTLDSCEFFQDYFVYLIETKYVYVGILYVAISIGIRFTNHMKQ